MFKNEFVEFAFTVTSPKKIKKTNINSIVLTDIKLSFPFKNQCKITKCPPGYVKVSD